MNIRKILIVSLLTLSMVTSQSLAIFSFVGIAHAQSDTGVIDDGDGRGDCPPSECNGDAYPPLPSSDFPSLDSSTPQQSSVAAQLRAAAQKYSASTNNFINSNPGIAALYKTNGPDVRSLLNLDSTSTQAIAKQLGINIDTLNSVKNKLQTTSVVASNIITSLNLAKSSFDDISNQLNNMSITDFASKLGVDTTSASAIASGLGLGNTITGIAGSTGLSNALANLGGLSGLNSNLASLGGLGGSLGSLGGLSGISGALGGLGGFGGMFGGGGDVNKTGLELNGYDQAELDACKSKTQDCRLDQRVVTDLVKLSTTGGDQGKGHLLKINRIIKNYGTSSQQLSKETAYPEESDRNVSAHNRGQAFDVSEIDQYQCTKSTGGKTPPKPILVAWQDKAPGQTLGDPSQPGATTQTGLANNIIKSGSSLFNGLMINGINGSTNLNIGANLSTVSSGASIPDLIQNLGRASLQDQLGGSAINPQGSLTDTAAALGRSILASSTNLAPQAFIGNNLNDLTTQISKVNLAQQLGLNPDSFNGNTVNDWLSSTAAGYIENSLNLRTGSLDTNRLNQGLSGIAKSKIETTLDLKNGSWSNKLGTISQNNSQPLTRLLQAPASYDQQLGIPSGSVENLIAGSISPNSFVNLVSRSIKSNNIDLYNNGKNADLAWNAPSGTISSLVNDKNIASAMKGFGAKILGDSLQLPQDQINSLINQAKNGSVAQINVAESPANVSLAPTDFVQVFNNQTSANIFQKDGQQLLNKVGNSTNQNLYNGLTKDTLKQLTSGSKSAGQIAKDLGLRQLENNFGLDSGSLDKVASSNIKSPQDLANIIGQDNLNAVANQLTRSFKLTNLPGNYKISTNDITQLLAYGRSDTLVQKAGSNAFGQIINAQPGYTQDATFGRISFNNLFANSTLKNLTGSIGIPLNPSANNQTLINVLKNNSNNLNAQSILGSLGVDTDKYNLNSIVNNVINDIKDGNKNSLGSMSGDLMTLSTQSLSTQAGLPQNTVTHIVTDPTQASAIANLSAVGSFEKTIGLPNGSITDVYTKDPTFNIFKGSSTQIALKKIMDKTGITVPGDANKLLTGDFEGGMKAVGIANFVKNANANNPNQNAYVDYATLAKAAFNNPSAIKDSLNTQDLKYQAIDAGANAAVNAIGTKNLARINTAYRIASQGLKNDANFQMMDSQLSKNLPDLPANFSKTIFTGDNSAKGTMLKDYATNMGLSKITDGSLSSATGLPIPSGTVASIKNGTFNATNFGQSVLNSPQTYAWADSTLGLPSGTASTLHSGYQQYQSLTSAFNSGDISSGELHVGEAMLGVTVVDQLTGGAVTGAINSITSPIDNALGLPAGGALQMGMALATGNYLQAGMMLAGALGINLGGLLGPLGGLGGLGGMFGFGGGTTCPDLQKLAQGKVKQLLSEIMAQAVIDHNNSNPEGLIPSQILTWRTEDIDYLNNHYSSVYGPTGRFGNAGISKSLNPTDIHVGY